MEYWSVVFEPFGLSYRTVRPRFHHSNTLHVSLPHFQLHPLGNWGQATEFVFAFDSNRLMRFGYRFKQLENIPKFDRAIPHRILEIIQIRFSQ
jgi:hypothetical protein